MVSRSKVTTYKLEVDTGNGKIKIDGLTKGFRKAHTAFAALEKQMSSSNSKFGRTEAYISKQISVLTQLRSSTAGTTEEWKKQTLVIDKLQAELRELQGVQSQTTASQNKLNKSQGQMIDKTGLAGATVVELGRTISDSNYGIRGMANNLSQLSTLFITLTVTAGGFANGLKALWTALAGPLGIIIVIQTLVTLMERAAMTAEKAGNAMDSIAESTGSAAVKLKVLKDVFEDVNISLDKKKKALEDVNREYEDLNLSVGENNRLTSESITRMDLKIKALERMAEAAAIMSVIEEELAKIAKAKASEADQGIMDDMKAAGRMLGQSAGGKKHAEHLADIAREEVEETVSKSQKMIDKLLKQFKDKGLFDYVFGSEDDTKGAGGRRIKLFKQQMLNLAELAERFRKESEKSDFLTREEQIKRETKYNEEELRLKVESYIEDRRQKFLHYAEEINASKHNDETKRKLIEDAGNKLTEEIEAAGWEQREVQKQIDAKELSEITLLNREKAKEKKKALDEVREIEYKIREVHADTRKIITENEVEFLAEERAILEDKKKDIADELTREQNRADKKVEIEKELQLKLAEINKEIAENEQSAFEAKMEKIQKVMEQITMMMDQAKATSDIYFETQVNKEEAHTATLNNQLQTRLNNETLTEQQRAGIQDQMAANDESLAKKKEELAEKQFKIDQAFRISTALMDTAAAAMKTYTAFAANPVLAAVMAGVSTAFGLAQVAMIASQKFVPSAIGGGKSGASASAPQAASPNFNIVGSSGINQLGETIGGQLARPTRAYVVSSDVSSAQELERNIVTGATIGG